MGLAVAAVPAGVATLRLSSDTRLQAELLAEADVKQAAEEVRKKGDFETQYRRLLADSLRVTRNIIPSLVDAVASVQASTGLQDRRVEVFVCDDPRSNASCMDFGDGRVFLLFTSRLLEALAPKELLFVVGHELGHAAFGHHALPANGVLKRGALPPPRALKLMSWSRRAEISCDRVGLLACGDLHAAATALIKLSSGLREPLLRFSLDDFMAQMRELQTLPSSPEEAEEWFSSHPFSPLRAAAASAFWSSKGFAGRLGRGDGSLEDAEAERRIEALLDEMEPTPAEARSEAGREALLWGGLWVALCDGSVAAVELESARHLAEPAAYAEAERQLSASSDRLALARSRFQQAAKRVQALSAPDRHALVQKLIVVARADGVLSPPERQALRDACSDFGLNPQFADQVLSLFD
jgi:Zn-dependent protease with chaperone function/tellurite resistance protein